MNNLQITPIGEHPKDKKGWSPNDRIVFPIQMIPVLRAGMALERGTANKILMKTWGGIGDQICAEPTLRWTLNNFQDCEISLASECPSLFQHLSFKKVFNLREERPIEENYFSIDTIMPPDHSNLLSQFVNHCTTNAVDFASICSLRCQLPVKDREIKLVPEPWVWHGDRKPKGPWVPVHAGKHWPSKTFPKDWWDQVLGSMISNGVTPVLIGADTDDNRSTVQVNTEGCLDMRNKLSLMGTVSLIHASKVILTNDSAPLHMAASAPETWIGYIATCKHPDFISHWRQGQWAWRMQNFGKGGMWDIIIHKPNSDQDLTVEFVDPEVLRSWLPAPEDFARFAIEKSQ